MCDEPDPTDSPAALSSLDRRTFAAAGVAAAAIAALGGGSARAADAWRPSRALVERTVRIAAPDGTADAFFVHPAAGASPGIVLWPDIAGLRPVFMDKARRLADAGFAVLAVNQYYRSAAAPVLDSFAAWRTPEGQARLKPMIAAITPAGTVADAKAFVAFLDAQPAVDKARRIGTSGYCMGGPFAVRTAAASPGRVGAAASLHGASLVGPGADSPVNLIERTRARFLFAIARNDDARAPGDKDALRARCAATGHAAVVDVYPADHGWTVADSPSYDAAAAARAEAGVLELFERL